MACVTDPFSEAVQSSLGCLTPAVNVFGLVGACAAPSFVQLGTSACSHCNVFFLTLSRGRPGAMSPSSRPMLPFLGCLHEELLRSENTSRASPSPPSRKQPTVALVRVISNSNSDKPPVTTLAKKIQAAHCPGARMLLSFTVLSMRKNPNTPL